MVISNTDTTGREKTVTEKEILDIFKDDDDIIKKELVFLQRTKSIIPTCKKGCVYCCRQPISASIPEVHAIGQYVKRNFDEKETTDLKTRILEWQSWIKTELPTYLQQGLDEAEALFSYGPYCPLLKENECSVYPVRPLLCRNYFVSSDVRSCLPPNNPNILDKEPSEILEIQVATEPCRERVMSFVEKTGMTFNKTVMLLSQSLLSEMNRL
jgi:Fe-S-cluster containining protein